LVKDGDIIEIDAIANTINVKVSDEELAERKKSWKPRPLESKGILAKYCRTVSSAALGCVTDRFND
jgi:dihydroxy-acid dehydratase